MTEQPSPHGDGFSMPPEWEPHQLTLMSWPCRADSYTGPAGGGASEIERARLQQAAVANAVAEFEPVLMVVRPEQAGEARRQLTAKVDLLEAELNDAWMRDNGPVFVRNPDGEVALVQFGFNAWGEVYDGYAADAAVPELVARHLGVRRYVAPMVLEGGSYAVDGKGTLITTEQCLLHPNRNPSMAREDIEQTLGAFLGITRVVWLGEGHYEDFSTDGHVDDICHFLAPGRVILHAPTDPDHPDHLRGVENLARLAGAADATGRRIDVVRFDTGTAAGIPYLNVYVCNGAVIAPIAGDPADQPAIRQIRAAYPGREIVTVRADVLFAYGGGGPHCITQQVPAGRFVH